MARLRSSGYVNSIDSHFLFSYLPDLALLAFTDNKKAAAAGAGEMLFAALRLGGLIASMAMLAIKNLVQSKPLPPALLAAVTQHLPDFAEIFKQAAARAGAGADTVSIDAARWGARTLVILAKHAAAQALAELAGSGIVQLMCDLLGDCSCVDEVGGALGELASCGVVRRAIFDCGAIPKLVGLLSPDWVCALHANDHGDQFQDVGALAVVNLCAGVIDSPGDPQPRWLRQLADAIVAAGVRPRAKGMFKDTLSFCFSVKEPLIPSRKPPDPKC